MRRLCSVSTSKRYAEDAEAVPLWQAKPMVLVGEKAACAGPQSVRCYELGSGNLLHSLETAPFDVAVLCRLPQPPARDCLAALELRSEGERGGLAGQVVLRAGWVEFGPSGGGKVIPHHETFSTATQPPYISTKG